MNKFLETQNLPKQNYEETENLNRPITSKETESVVKNLQTLYPLRKGPEPNDFTSEFYQTLKK